jgi:hypothetical protein
MIEKAGDMEREVADFEARGCRESSFIAMFSGLIQERVFF